MAKYNNILVAIDGSAEAKKAFNEALEIAKQNEAKVILAHVVELYPTYYASPDEQAIIESGQQLLAEYEGMVTSEGIKAETVIRRGSPKQIIPKELVKEFEVDLVVCGSQGLSALEQFLLGSVSESIARHATCNVLIVRN